MFRPEQRKRLLKSLETQKGEHSRRGEHGKSSVAQEHSLEEAEVNTKVRGVHVSGGGQGVRF